MIKKTIISVIIAIIVSIVIAIFLHNSSSNDIIATLEKAVEKESVESLETLFSSSEQEVDTIALESFLASLLEDEKKLEEIIESVSSQMKEETKDTEAIVQVKLDKKKFGLFPTYTASLQEKEVHITGVTLKEVNVKVDHINVKRKNKNDLHYGPIYAGEHLVEVQFENELGSFHIEEEMELWEESSIDILVDEEEIIVEDEPLKAELLEYGALFTKSLVSMSAAERQKYRIQMTGDLEAAWKNEQDLALAGASSLEFQEVMMDEDSYDMVLISDIWHSSLRMIVTYKDPKGKSLFVLYELDLFYDPYVDQWFVQKVVLSEVEQSLLEFWDDDLIYYEEDLKDGGVPFRM